MKRRIYFRADGHNSIGLGHLVRCFALSQMLKEHFEITFLCKFIPSSFRNSLRDSFFGFHQIKDDNDLLEIINPDNLVVLDNYELDIFIQIQIKKIGCKLICIDDLCDRESYADLIINHAPNIKSSNYKAQFYTQFALGLDYALLRPYFLNNRKAKKNKIDVEKKVLFICFGGSDSKKITEKVIEIVRNDYRFETIFVVVGAAYENCDYLVNRTINDARYKILNDLSSEEIAEVMLKADLAIVPASGILQEALALNVDVISGMYIDNQKYIFENYLKLNAFISADCFSTTSIQNAINEYFSSDNKRTKNLIDGKSGQRLLKIFQQLIGEDDVLLRKADASDLMKTYDWASNPDLRKFFFNKKVISFQEHSQWFFRIIKSSNCFYYIGELDQVPFGFIRFNIENETAKISYLIDPAYHGKGLGVILLNKGLKSFLQNYPKISWVVGEVLFGNFPSIKLFERLGYNMEICVDAAMYKFIKEIKYAKN